MKENESMHPTIAFTKDGNILTNINGTIAILKDGSINSKEITNE